MCDVSTKTIEDICQLLQCQPEDFTIEDIHKIREYHYELTKDMTTQEKINFYNEGGRAFLKEMEERKLQNA